MLSSAIRIYLALLALGWAALGALVWLTATRLPFGDLAPAAGLICLAWSLWTGIRFLRLRKAARHLVTGELLTMNASDIPVKKDHTYLGHAFLWNPRHAELLGRAYALGIEPPQAVQDRFGGNTLLHGLGRPDEAPLFIPNSKRSHHMLVLGAPGEGKTRCLELLVRQLVAQGDVTVIIDPKGDDRLMSVVRQACSEAGREDAFKLLTLPWPTASVAYNPLANFGTPADLADRLIGILPPSPGESEIFRGFQWGATKAVVQALYLAKHPITISRVLAGLRDVDSLLLELITLSFKTLSGGELENMVEAYEKLATSHPDRRMPEVDDLIFYSNLDETYYGKMIASFLPQLERLSAGAKREILSPEPDEKGHEVLSWSMIDRHKLVVYVNLGSLHGEESATAVGKMMLLDLQAYVAERYSYRQEKPHRMSLLVDEAHHMLSKAFMNILAEARGADLGMVLSSQTLAQFEMSLGSRAAVDEILTQNFLHMQFQSRNPREAEDFSKLAGDRLLRNYGEAFRYEPAFFNSGDRNVADFKAIHTLSVSDVERPLVPPWAITQLPTFHYFLRMAGRIYKGRIPLLEAPRTSLIQGLQEGLKS